MECFVKKKNDPAIWAARPQEEAMVGAKAGSGNRGMSSFEDLVMNVSFGAGKQKNIATPGCCGYVCRVIRAGSLPAGKADSAGA